MLRERLTSACQDPSSLVGPGLNTEILKGCGRACARPGPAAMRGYADARLFAATRTYSSGEPPNRNQGGPPRRDRRADNRDAS